MTSPSSSVLPVSLSIAVLTALLTYLFSVYERAYPRQQPSLLREIAAHQFAWGSSTTPIPISSVSVLAKSLLSRDTTALPRTLHLLIPTDDTLPIQPVRDYTNDLRLHRIKQFCTLHDCNPSESDPLFGLTPLHLASMSGDAHLAEYLTHLGAVPQVDHVDRLPRNLSFAQFIPNSKKWARAAGRHDCDFPIVDYDGSPEARAETRRLVGEGEPVLLRGAYSHYAGRMDWSVMKWVERFRDTPVTVGHVPYAAAFNLSTDRMSLGEYYERFVKPESDAPLYVFNKGKEVVREGYEALGKLVEEAFPTPKLVAHPDETGGLSGIHFFFGKKGSGAPFHIHADAVNAAVSGKKKWFVFTPGKTLYSRKTIKRWVEEDYPNMKEEDRPLECLQKKGDVVYVPLDWGHAVLNVEENTFGYALELLNRRDTLSHLWR